MSQTEIWAYAGRRYLKGKMYYCWVQTETGREFHFSKYKAHAVGGLYRVDADLDTEGTVVVSGTPEFAQDGHGDGDRVAVWRALDAKAAADLQRDRTERKMASEGPLDAALEPLERILKKCRTFDERDALIAVVTSRLRRTK